MVSNNNWTPRLFGPKRVLAYSQSTNPEETKKIKVVFFFFLIFLMPFSGVGFFFFLLMDPLDIW
jgi:hypothetical protein